MKTPISVLRLVKFILICRFKKINGLHYFSCWLSLEDGIIWAFVGPALLVIAVNSLYHITGSFYFYCKKWKNISELVYHPFVKILFER